MASAEKPTCFVIAPIGSNESDIRKRSDKVLKHIFRKALAEKYQVIRGDEIDEPGMITSQVLRAVQEAALVVADLTGHNPNVLYELAVRHAIEKPIIHVIEPKLSKIPFDIAGFRTIEFDLTDPDSIESAVEQLKKQTEQAENGKWGETPVKLANIMRRSKEDSKDTILLKQAVEGIAALRTTITLMSSQMSLLNPLPMSYYTGAVPTGAVPIFGGGKTVDMSTLLNPQNLDGSYGLVTPPGQASQPDEIPTQQRKRHATLPIRRRNVGNLRDERTPGKKPGES
jgi:hypothetical protein